MSEHAQFELKDDPPPGQLRLFPLADHVLLPGLPTPYRIFEPRYRQLVEDLLALPESERWLAIPTLVRSTSDQLIPSFHDVATAVRMVHCSLLDKGHYLIVVLGSRRCLLEEIPSDALYRLARTEPFDDASVTAADTIRSGVDTLLQLLAALMPYLGPGAENLPAIVKDRDDPSLLVYRLASISLIDPQQRLELLRTRDLSARIEIVREALASALALAMSKDEMGPQGQS